MTIFDDYRTVLDSVEAKADIVEAWVERVLAEPQNCSVVLTGIGKSFLNAQMGAAVLQSVSVQATAIHATDLLHGGLGYLHAQGGGAAVLIMLSHSGNTKEVYDVATRLKWTDSMLVTGNKKGKLRTATDVIVEYDCPRDGSRHGTIPAVSNIGQQAVLNLITCQIADTMDVGELLSNHPAGSLAVRYEEI